MSTAHSSVHLQAPPPDYLASCLELPFFEPAHAELARQAHDWAQRTLPDVAAGAADLDAHCRALVKALGAAGLLRYCVPRAWARTAGCATACPGPTAAPCPRWTRARW